VRKEGNMRERKPGESQEDYCRDCLQVCNVVLRDGEPCEDRIEGERK